MLWEELTAGEIKEACAQTKGTCIIPLGAIEKHGGHMPLGTDMYVARHLAEEVTKLEPAVVFPYYMFGQIAEARHCPGTIAIRPELLMELLNEICCEISRNGFKKIVILNTHGGNTHFLRYFVQSMLYGERDYFTYVVSPPYDEEVISKTAKMLGTDDFGEHAGNHETSVMLALRPELVKLERLEPEGAKAHGLLTDINNTAYTPVFWYADHPTHQAGDPTSANAEAGRFILENAVSGIAAIIKAIKEDTRAAGLLETFYKGCNH